jgi:hypothetical protein
MAEADFEQKAKEYEAKEAAVKAALAKVFDVKALVARTAQIKEVNHPVLGIIRFGELTLNDTFTLAECKTDKERTAMAAYLMLKKADSALTLEEMQNLPMLEGAALLQFIAEQPAFLSQPKTSEIGHAATNKPAKSRL